MTYIIIVTLTTLLVLDTSCINYQLPPAKPPPTLPQPVQLPPGLFQPPLAQVPLALLPPPALRHRPLNVLLWNGYAYIYINAETVQPVKCFRVKGVVKVPLIPLSSAKVFAILTVDEDNYWCEDSAKQPNKIFFRIKAEQSNVQQRKIITEIDFDNDSREEFEDSMKPHESTYQSFMTEYSIADNFTSANLNEVNEFENVITASTLLENKTTIKGERHIKHECPAQIIQDDNGKDWSLPQLNIGEVYFFYENNCVKAARQCMTNLNGDLQHLAPLTWDRNWPEPCEHIEINLANTATELHKISNKTTVSKADVSVAVDLVNQALQVNRSMLMLASKDTLSIVKGLDEVLTKLRLNPGENLNQVYSQVAIFVVNLEKNQPYGLVLEGKSGNNLVGSSLSILNKSIEVSSSDIDVAVLLPKDMKGTHISVAIFNDDSAFQTQNTCVNSHVVSINLVDGTLGRHGIDIVFRPISKQENFIKECVFWDLISSKWSTEGCQLKSEGTQDICHCSHLTHFAEIISPIIFETNDSALDIISVIGCSLSLAGLMGIFLTGALFWQWRSQLGNKILLHLSAAVALNMLVFLITGTELLLNINGACIALGVLLHYSVLASFCWMFVSAGLQFLRLVSVFGTYHISHILIKAALFAWGAPLIPVVVVLAVDVNLYADNSRGFCYPKDLAFYVSIVCPILIMLIANLIIFFMILHRIYGKNSLQKHVKSERTYILRKLFTSVLLFFLFGLTWLFGLLAGVNIVLAYLFCITATLQGVILFSFFILGEHKSRQYWTNKRSLTFTTSSTPAEAVALRSGEET